ncbi:Tn3 family transposase [Candidatus Cardinium hertigii]|uniref:Tn3 family transposase n=1 Tax=Candidatus Cardinium hertigii TaxID=247481 RepID=UPI003D7CAF63
MDYSINESYLALEEHYTDNQGYTEINFASFALLGRTFSPRIRGVQHQKIYRIDEQKDYASLRVLGKMDLKCTIRLHIPHIQIDP